MTPATKEIAVRAPGALRALVMRIHREREFLLTEVLKVRGLMPLLMKSRNKQPWTAEDKAELALHLRRLSMLSPYLVVLAMPGGVLVLPFLSWWLDRRRNRQRKGSR